MRHCEHMESPTLERAVLAGALFTPETALRVAEELSERDFADSTRRHVFTAIAELVAEGKPADSVAVKGWFEQRGAWTADLRVLLATLDVDLPDIDRIEVYCEQLREVTAKRRVWLFADRLGQSAEEQGATGSDVLASAMRELEDIATGSESRRQLATREEMSALIDDHLEREPTEILGLSTGIRGLDRVTMGLCPGKLVIVAGRPGMGKSAFGLKLCREATLRQDKAALLITLEMGRDEIAFRELSAETRITCNTILARLLSAGERERIQRYLERARDSRLLIDDSSATTVPEIMFRARREHGRGRLDLLVIDYLQLLSSHRRFDNRDQEIGHMTRSLKQLARSLEIPVVLLAQLSRKPEERSNPRPHLSDLRESGNIEQDADIVLFPYRPAVYDVSASEEDMEIIVQKNRGGETGVVEVCWHGPTMDIRDPEAYPRAAEELF